MPSERRRKVSLRSLEVHLHTSCYSPRVYTPDVLRWRGLQCNDRSMISSFVTIPVENEGIARWTSRWTCSSTSQRLKKSLTTSVNLTALSGKACEVSSCYLGTSQNYLERGERTPSHYTRDMIELCEVEICDIS